MMSCNTACDLPNGRFRVKLSPPEGFPWGRDSWQSGALDRIAKESGMFAEITIDEPLE